jgi:hypothetical protein
MLEPYRSVNNDASECKAAKPRLSGESTAAVTLQCLRGEIPDLIREGLDPSPKDKG